MRGLAFGIASLFLVSACGDPLRDVARVDDVAVDDGLASVAEAPAEASNTGGGLFSRLLNRSADDPTNAAVEAALADAGVAAEDEEASPSPEEPQERRGLFGGLFGGNGSSAEDATVTEAAAEPAAPAAPRTGLAGFFRRAPDAGPIPRNGPDADDVPAGAILPFGQIARVCDVSRGDLGRKISDEAGFEIYDTLPSSTAPRPFYIMGFDDNCARTFTGAVAIAGDIQTHEFVRYQPSNERIGYTAVDNAYEALKASVCRVGRGQPCGAQSNRLNRNTQFITVYDFFGGTFSSVPTEWTQILIHDGRVLAISQKDG